MFNTLSAGKMTLQLICLQIIKVTGSGRGTTGILNASHITGLLKAV